MGKKGKLLKKARVERTVNTIPIIKTAAKEESENESDSDSHDGSEIGIDQEKLKQDECVAITVLEAITKKPEVYHSKDMKCLRTALFPLINAQKNAFFDAVYQPPTEVTGDPLSDPLSAKKVATLISVTTTYSSAGGKALFSSSACKKFRRALHPIVQLHVRHAPPRPPDSCPWSRWILLRKGGEGDFHSRAACDVPEAARRRARDGRFRGV